MTLSLNTTLKIFSAFNNEIKIITSIEISILSKRYRKNRDHRGVITKNTFMFNQAGQEEKHKHHEKLGEP